MNCVQSVRTDSNWAGEEVLLAAADYLQRDILVHKYITVSGSSPMIYHPAAGERNDSPISLAFYEPGHHRTVICHQVVPECSDGSTSGQYRSGNVQPPRNNTDMLTFLYFNARSLISKFDDAILEASVYKPKIICVSETWFKCNSNVNLNGYASYTSCRNVKSGGGTMSRVVIGPCQEW